MQGVGRAAWAQHDPLVRNCWALTLTLLGRQKSSSTVVVGTVSGFAVSGFRRDKRALFAVQCAMRLNLTLVPSGLSAQRECNSKNGKNLFIRRELCNSSSAKRHHLRLPVCDWTDYVEVADSLLVGFRCYASVGVR